MMHQPQRECYCSPMTAACDNAAQGGEDRSSSPGLAFFTSLYKTTAVTLFHLTVSCEAADQHFMQNVNLLLHWDTNRPKRRLFTQGRSRKGDKNVSVYRRHLSLQPNPILVCIRCLINPSVKNYFRSHKCSQCQLSINVSAGGICLGKGYLIIVPPLFCLNDKSPHIRYGHLYGTLARGLILHDQVRRRDVGGVHLDLKWRCGGRENRLQRECNRWNRMWGKGTWNIDLQKITQRLKCGMICLF